MFSLIFENPSRNIAILYFLSFEKSDSNIRKNKLLFFFTDVVHSISFGQNLRLQDVQMLPIYILVFWIFIMHTHTHTNHFPCSLFFFFCEVIFFLVQLFFFLLPTSESEPFQSDANHIVNFSSTVQRQWLGALMLNVEFEMILQIRAHSRQILDNIDPF